MKYASIPFKSAGDPLDPWIILIIIKFDILIIFIKNNNKI